MNAIHSQPSRRQSQIERRAVRYPFNAVRCPRGVLTLLLSSLALATGCITSPVGFGEEAKQIQLSECPDGLLDDLEDANNQTAKTGGRGGYWFTFVDELGSTIQPKGQFEVAEGGAQGSKYAARMHGTMAGTGDVYAGMGFKVTEISAPYDASVAKGIRFWAKGPGTIRFKTPDVNTDPSGDRCDDCYNDFGVDIYLSEEWVRYTVPFEKMKQQPGWGDRAPHVASDALIAIQWQYSTRDRQYDIWIDDISLVGCE